jgi:hypothetical protein
MFTQTFETLGATPASARRGPRPQSARMRILGVLVLLVLFACVACGDKGQPLEGVDLTNLSFHLYAPDMGVYPSTSVLSDPNNPFVHVSADALNNGTPAQPALKWVIGGAAPAPVAFYSWATALATAPNGENQYYTATKLHSIYTDQLAAPADIPTVKQMAIDGYTALLTYFPEDYGRNADGTLAFDFATPSLQAIIALGGAAPQGWVLVTGSDGTARAVRI